MMEQNGKNIWMVSGEIIGTLPHENFRPRRLTDNNVEG